LELKLANGIKISVSEDEGMKLLKFDQPVRAIALVPDEATRLGASLYRSKRIVLLPALLKLLEAHFFDKPRSFGEIRTALTALNLSVKSSSLTMALSTLHRKKFLSRTGKPRAYVYARAESAYFDDVE
jgi:hypothetical protein